MRFYSGYPNGRCQAADSFVALPAFLAEAEMSAADVRLSDTDLSGELIVFWLVRVGCAVLSFSMLDSGRPRGRKLLAWDWECSAAVSGRYCGLYPRSWTVYDVPGLQLRLMLRQISPVVPGEYKDSSLPVGVFVWTVENNSSRALSVSICSTFKNGTGGSDDAKGACWSELSCGDTNAVLLHHQYRGADLTYCLAARQQAGVETTACLGFDPNGTGQALWQSLASTGQLSDNFCSKDKPPKPSPVSELGMALNCQVQVAAGERRSFEQALVWDMPLIHFKSRQMQYRRRYSRWFSGDGAAVRIAEHAFKQYRHWEDSLDAWQNTILDDPKLPAWFKSALLNQLYYVADGGTVWVDVPDEEAASFPKDDPRLEYGRFAYLESHEYRMFNTYDVHFYASWALAMLWPELQRSLQYDMAMYTRKEDHTDTRFLFSGVKGVLKTANTLPHDIGNPEDEPFLKINAYIAHDVNDWKDLNLKFVLQVYRDYKLFGNDMKYLSDMWATCEVVMATSAKFDTDGDGLIENGGYADQTFDTWIMHGPSAYCCSLWLASISAMEEMAGALQKEEHRAKYSQLLIKAQASFEEKLWNGSYYNFDSSKHRRHETIMSDQLVGHWYLSLAGHQKEVFKPDHVRKALNTLYDYNVLKFCGGKMGAVNGIMPDGGVDNGILQSYEMWPGCAFALAATFIHEGMTEEGFRTAEGIYNTTYYDVGLGFDMPEALYEDGHYRAVGYMRPLSIWSMYQAYKLSQSKK
ncbi:Glycosyl-hydrolase family 116 catalytic region [Trinorchestia longiramus]|nr:Glycosyl-hydrolase family 116 catalytic region [Trinorchestia longiramus]